MGVTRIFQKGVKLCQTEGTKQFWPPEYCRLFAWKKKLAKRGRGGGSGGGERWGLSRAPQDLPLATLSKFMELQPVLSPPLIKMVSYIWHSFSVLHVTTIFFVLTRFESFLFTYVMRCSLFYSPTHLASMIHVPGVEPSIARALFQTNSQLPCAKILRSTTW